jgi:beta-glucanase (GH16 family)
MTVTKPPRAPARSPWRQVRFARIWVVVAVAVIAAGALTVWNWSYEDTHWHPLVREDFSQDIAVGDFPGDAYADDWTVYPDGWGDTSGVGTYAPSRVLSTEGGILRFDLHSDGKDFLGAALLAAETNGQRFGRYSIRWRADPVTGYGLAFLLWPDSGHWPNDGEIDFPEGALDGTIKAYAHYASGDGGQDQFDTGTTMQDWHTSVIEWTPDAITFHLDGRFVGRSTTDVPQIPMHLVLQAGTAGDDEPPRDARGAIEVDWVHVDSYTS